MVERARLCSGAHDDHQWTLSNLDGLAAHAELDAASRRHEDVPSLAVLIDLASLERYDIYVVMLALNALDRMDRRALSAVDSIRALPTSHPSVMPSMKSYVPRLVEKILADVGA